LGGDGGGLDMADDGSISVGSAFTVIEDAWNRGLAAMVRAGVNLVLDEVLLSGAESQARVRAAFGDLYVLWVGVRCTPELAAEREAARGDRVVGQAAHQAATAHEGVVYDLEVDTSTTSSDEAARTIVATLDAVAPGG
jgi:chloramphenicol 3-O phosphotransferase